MDFYIKLAKETIKHYLLTKKFIEVPNDLPAEMLNKRAGVFICFKNKGELRGCIGTFMPVYENIAQEIIQNTISAATQDHRFVPVDAAELKNLKITIDVLAEPEKVPEEEAEKLNPKIFGILVKSEDGFKSGLLLPNLEGVNAVDEQISIACDKAGIDPYTEDFIIYKFTVERHEE
jgi:AmmeMemoRadiSam system protein A